MDDTSYTYDNSIKCQKDHVETSEFREILDLDTTNARNGTVAILIENSLNIMRIQYPNVTREYSYQDHQGELVRNRVIIMMKTLRNFRFQQKLLDIFTVDSAVKIVDTYFDTNMYQVIDLLRLNEHWNMFPKNLTLPFYEINVALDRFSSNLQIKVNMGDVEANKYVRDYLEEQTKAFPRLTTLISTFNKYPKFEYKETLTKVQKTAMQTIFNHYITKVNKSITELNNLY